MGWQDLLASTETFTLPWTGDRDLRGLDRVFQLVGRLPPELGWHSFRLASGRKVQWIGVGELDTETLQKLPAVFGYLVGDRLIPDTVSATLGNTELESLSQSEPIFFAEEGLERFSRIRARRWPNGQLIYEGQEFPLGPEEDLRKAFQDQQTDVRSIPHITPAMDLAFRFEFWHRAETQKRREMALAIEQQVAVEAERKAQKERLASQIGSGEGRRLLAKVDFGAACAAALAVGGGELLDWRNYRQSTEAVVQFRFLGRRFECVCHKETLRIVDAGVCLTQGGVSGDTRFTLESLLPVIRDAHQKRVLVVLRHVGDDDYEDQEDEDY